MSRSLSRRQMVLMSASITLMSGCSGFSRSGSDERDSTGTPNATPQSPPETSAELPVQTPTVPLQYPLDQVERSIVPGGPPPDGIPSIDNPEFVVPSEADSFLDPGDIVFGVREPDVAKAYPQHVLVKHEIVNDRLADTPVSITYCPLTGTVQGFENGGITFGVSGGLVNSNLVMFDRQTESLWPQLIGRGVTGRYRGWSLPEFRVIWTTWERWRAVHPNTQILSESTGYARNYDQDRYGAYNPPRGYYASGAPIYPVMFSDSRLQPKRVVIGSRNADGAIAFVKDRLRRSRLLVGAIDGAPYLAVYDDHLDTGYVYRNPDGRSFQVDGNRYVGADGASYGANELPLERSLAFDSMWFAWYAFFPDTFLYQ